MEDSNTKKIVRPKDNRVIAGVCIGIAEYFKVDPTIVRVVWVVASLLTGVFLGILVYIVCWIIILEDES